MEALAPRVLETSEGCQGLFPFGELAGPSDESLDIEASALAADDAFHVDEILRTSGDELIDDEVPAEQVRSATS